MKKNIISKQVLYERMVKLSIVAMNTLYSIILDYRYKSIIEQLVRSIGSIGANYSEGNGSLSRKEFTLFLNYSKKSAIESIYWIDVLTGLNQIGKKSKFSLCKIRREILELKRILTSSIITLRNKKS